MEFISKSLEDTKKIAFDFVKTIKPNGQGALVVGLYGELGSGKTTFMKYFAEALGVTETIQSPTFVIMKFFNFFSIQSFNKLIHIDAYRLDSGGDLVKLGWEKIIADSNNLICIEWPERIADILPPLTKIYFNHISPGERRIIINSL